MGKQVGNMQLMQKMNRLEVLNFIRRNPDVVRPVISEQTGLSLASITNITAYLLEAGLLEESGMEPAERVGRKSTLLRFRAQAYGLICAALHEEYMRIAYTDLEGNVIECLQIETKERALEQIMTQIRDQVGVLLDKHGAEHTLGICVTFSGMVLDESYFAISSSMRWKSFPIKELLEQDTGLPVFIINNSLLKAIWYFCCGKQPVTENMLFVDLENGIGAVQFYRGAISHAVLGEIGHTTVEKDGELCFCGNRGCLEAMCSAERVVRLYEQVAGKRNAQLEEISLLYEQGEEAARYAVEDCARYLGIGLANLVNLFHPSVLIINMGEFAKCRALTQQAAQECHRRAFPALTQKLEICEIAVGEEDTLRGAAFEMCDRLFDLSFDRNPVQ